MGKYTTSWQVSQCTCQSLPSCLTFHLCSNVFFVWAGVGASQFTINATTGVISTRRGLDIDVRNFYRLQVTAQNYQIVNGQMVIRPSRSPRSTAYVNILVVPSTGAPSSMIKKEVNMCKSSPVSISVDRRKLYPPYSVIYCLNQFHLVLVDWFFPHPGTSCSLIVVSAEWLGSYCFPFRYVIGYSDR